MGRKGQNKQQKLNKANIHCNGIQKGGEGNLKLSPLKKNDLNKLVDKLLKGKRMISYMDLFLFKNCLKPKLLLFYSD